MNENDLSREIIGAAIEVHRYLGPGLLESAYSCCLARELCIQGIDYIAELPVALEYKGEKVDAGYRLDFLIDRKVIIELKSVDKFLPIHDAQLLSYLRLTEMKLGLLINFNVPILKNGVKRIVNNL